MRFRLLNDMRHAAGHRPQRDPDLRARRRVQQHVRHHVGDPAAADGDARRLLHRPRQRRQGPAPGRADAPRAAALVRRPPSQVLRKARIPNAVPYLFTALEIAAPAAVITAFVAEYFGGPQNGLGSRITSNIDREHRRRPGPTCSAPACSGWCSTWSPSLLESITTHHRGASPGGGTHMRTRRGRAPSAGVAGAALVAAACGDDDDDDAAARGAGDDRGAGTTAAPATTRRRHDRRRRRHGGAGHDAPRAAAPAGRVRHARPGEAAAAVVHPGAVRRLLRRRRPGLLRRPVPRRRDHRGRRRHRAAAGARRRRGRLRHRLGAQGAADPRGRAPTSSTSPRSSSARARCRCRSRTPASPRRPTSPARTIGNWGFGNEYEIFAALGQAGLDPATDVELVQQQFDMVGLLDGRHRRRRGDDVQRVRPGARGREPRHRRAVHARRLQRRLLRGRRRRHAAGRDLGRRRAARRRRRYSDIAVALRRRLDRRAGRTAATTPRRAATSSSPPARSSATATSCGR